MTNIDPHYLLKLIAASEIFSEDQKVTIKTSLPKLNVVKLVELQTLLEKEQAENKDYYEKLMEIEKRSGEAKIKAIYHYAEDKVHQQELAELESLDEELAALSN